MIIANIIASLISLVIGIFCLRMQYKYVAAARESRIKLKYKAYGALECNNRQDFEDRREELAEHIGSAYVAKDKLRRDTTRTRVLVVRRSNVIDVTELLRTNAKRDSRERTKAAMKKAYERMNDIAMILVIFIKHLLIKVKGAKSHDVKRK